jgi:uncharacterized membrane protein YkgB
MARTGVVLLRINLGIVFLWFGALKFFPDLSPAQDLAPRAIGRPSGRFLPLSACTCWRRGSI